MFVQGYLIMEPGMDRPCFSHSPPTTYQKKAGAKVYSFLLDVPDFAQVDGHLSATIITPHTSVPE